MLSIAGQTAGPIVKKFEFILKIFFQIFFSRATPGPSASILYYDRNIFFGAIGRTKKNLNFKKYCTTKVQFFSRRR